ncbi:MAG: toll/interleukin-1 receptor domain-containing protein [Prevotellaceae bacterium]|jgi:hypothetical protein|nr:toll/interleukin-1 receptor domain-containing protein [Prevotellaceae bacterium]
MKTKYQIIILLSVFSLLWACVVGLSNSFWGFGSAVKTFFIFLLVETFLTISVFGAKSMNKFQFFMILMALSIIPIYTFFKYDYQTAVVVAIYCVTPFILMLVDKLLPNDPNEQARNTKRENEENYREYEYFISFAPEDRDIAKKIAECLEAQGERCLISPHAESPHFISAVRGPKINRDEEKLLRKEIAINLKKCRYFLFVSSAWKLSKGTGGYAKAIHSIPVNASSLNHVEMSIWTKRYVCTIYIARVAKSGESYRLELHTWEPAYLTIGYVDEDAVAFNEQKEALKTQLEKLLSNGVKDTTDVHFMMAAKKETKQGIYADVDVYAYSKEFEKLVADEVRAELGKANTRKSSPHTLACGAKLEIELLSPNITIEDNRKKFVWEDEYCKAMFQIYVPDNYHKEQIALKAFIFADDVLIEQISSAVDIKKLDSNRKILDGITGRIKKLFVSYASEDRDKVMDCVKTIKSVSPQMEVIIDEDSITQEKLCWNHKLEGKITSSDVFYLYWSRYASISDLVREEYRYAIKKGGAEFIVIHILESTETPPPLPDELSGCKHNTEHLMLREISTLEIENYNYTIKLHKYNDMKIEMAPLPKAVFILFLRHEEGIILKEISDYKDELTAIYQVINNRTTDEQENILNNKTNEKQEKNINKSIEKICKQESLNEMITRIKEAFNDPKIRTVADNYFITGDERGGVRKIKLDRKLVVLPEKFNRIQKANKC